MNTPEKVASESSLPNITIVIATHNSATTIEKTLASVSRQNYPNEKIELLIIDGKSADETIKIARLYGARVIDNPKIEPGHAKYLGLINATGEYVAFLDSDETLDNVNSIKNKVKLALSNPNIPIIMSQGYVTPSGYGFLTKYINEFGDPFSCFMYRLSKSSEFFLQTMQKRYEVAKCTPEYLLCDIEKTNRPPLIEVTTMASLMNVAYLRKMHSDLFEKSHLIPHAFYLITQKNPLLAIMKQDPITHYSSTSLHSYIGKIRSRIRNNIHFSKDTGLSGYSGRSQFDTSIFKAKRFLFIPYSLLIFPAFLDSLYLTTVKRDIRYLMHIPLSFYTASNIVLEYIKHLLKIKQLRMSYGENTSVND